MIVRYTPDHFPLVAEFARQVGATPLLYQGFVDHYYASSEHGRLFLLLKGETIEATVGVEYLPMQAYGKRFTLGFGSNFYSRSPGLGGLLFLHWLKSCDAGVVFGGSADTHALVKRTGWRYFDGLYEYTTPFEFRCWQDEPRWKAALKTALRTLLRRHLVVGGRNPRYDHLSIHEESGFEPSLLAFAPGPACALRPDADYLNWRYSPQLPFIRYRLFRLLSGRDTAGYVVIKDDPREIVVSHGDASDPSWLAFGSLLALEEVMRQDRQPRPVVITASHAAVRGVLASFGLRALLSPRPFAVSPLRRGPEVPTDLAEWCVNFGWGDNDLRPPFRA